MSSVYALVLKGTREVRYVGMTRRTLSRRLTEHKYSARTGTKTPRDAWMRKYDCKVDIILLEAVSDISQLPEREVYWIAKYADSGRLLNATPGGDGIPLGYKFSKPRRPKTEAEKSHIRRLRTGSTHTEETKRKISAIVAGSGNPFYGRTHTEEAKQKNREAHTGKNNSRYGVRFEHTDETKRKISEGLRGKEGYSLHCRWHVNRDIVKEGCKYCEERTV